jgi:polysaccharide export outer membrane protein
LTGIMPKNRLSHAVFSVTACLSIAALSGCTLMSAAGPSSRRIHAADDQTVSSAPIKIVDVNDAVARQILASSRSLLFSESLGDAAPIGSVIGRGDAVDIAIWEAPPAALFGAVGAMGELGQVANQTARATSLPEQMVDNDGYITVPFAGRVQAAGRTPQQIARDITARIAGMAHLPQVIVRLSRNATKNVTVVGDVSGSTRVPLTAKGERLLDILAAAGGVRQPVNKTMIQITRGSHVASLPLATVIEDPRQNIRLAPDDVVTAFFQPYSFTALGATNANAEVPFEGTGITLAQALGRVGGLQDFRADVKGAFIFRLEDPAALDPALREGAQTTPDGRVPVIYRINMRDPATFFVAQSFPIRNKDVLYVSNAPLADFQKFLNIVSSIAVPVVTIKTATE